MTRAYMWLNNINDWTRLTVGFIWYACLCTHAIVSIMGFIMVMMSKFIAWTYTTVVPALGDPRRERPPAVYGNVINVPTHINIKLPEIGGHLPNADNQLLVVRPCYNWQCKQIPCFGGNFNPKSLVRTLTCHRQFAQISVLSSAVRDKDYIKVFRACLGAQLTICAQKWRNFVLFSTVSLRFVLSRVCVFLYSRGPWWPQAIFHIWSN